MCVRVCVCLGRCNGTPFFLLFFVWGTFVRLVDASSKLYWKKLEMLFTEGEALHRLYRLVGQQPICLQLWLFEILLACLHGCFVRRRWR